MEQSQLSNTEQSTVNELTDYVTKFIEVRFPNGLPPAVHGIISDVIVDAFHDGARWAEQQEADESRVILTH